MHINLGDTVIAEGNPYFHEPDRKGKIIYLYDNAEEGSISLNAHVEDKGGIWDIRLDEIVCVLVNGSWQNISLSGSEPNWPMIQQL